jgi:AraC-like DNA-binding protein
MNSTPFALRPTFQVSALYSFHYFEFAKDFIFPGERHDFWEFLYVDQGEIDIYAEELGYSLKQGEIIFHQPNEFHSVWANRKIAPNVMVVSFQCHDAEMRHFANKIFTIDDHERTVIVQLLKLATQTFYPPLDDPYYHELTVKTDAPYAALQQIRMNIELLLILLRSKEHTLQREYRLSTIIQERGENEIIQQAKRVMESHMYQDLSFDQICELLKISKSRLTEIFNRKCGVSVMKYYKYKKIELAKTLIREGNLTFTEISDQLKFNSVHTFSRSFKQMVGTPPTVYAKSAMSRAQT